MEYMTLDLLERNLINGDRKMEKITTSVKGTFYLLGDKNATDTLLKVMPKAIQPVMKGLLVKEFELDAKVYDKPQSWGECATFDKKRTAKEVEKFWLDKACEKALTNMYDEDRNEEVKRLSESEESKKQLADMTNALTPKE